MAYDIAPLKSYVRFYLAIVSQLERVWQSLVSIETAMRDELGPFAPDLEGVPLTAIATLTDPPRELPAGLAQLFRPEDEAELDGMCDVYEVVGRFSFQGDGDRNLARVSDLVKEGRAAARENDEALRALAPLVSVARETATRMREREAERAAADRESRIEKLEPLVETVLLRAKQTQDALHAVAIPALDDAATAADEYKRLRARMQQVYQTCLPFLKNAIDKVWSSVSAPSPQSFPEELPLVAELPPELVALSVAGSEELEKAERTLQALAEEGETIKRTKEEIASRLGKLHGDAELATVKRDEVAQDIELSRALLDWARITEQVAAHRSRAVELEAELGQRVAITAQCSKDAAKLKTELDLEAEKVAEQTKSLEAMVAELASRKEPLLFGKEDFRTKYAETEAAIQVEREALTQLLHLHAQHKFELSAAEVRVQTAQAEQAIVERSLADVRGRADAAEKALTALSEVLGSKRPTRPVPPEEIEEIVVALEAKREQAEAELARIRTEQRRFKEDGIRTSAREKQIDVERQQYQARVESARVARAEGIEAAYRTLAAERKSAVEDHVREVLSALSKSLGQVGTVFVDPARERVMALTEPDYGKAERLEKAAEAVGPVVERLLAERGPEIASVEELLERVQREFCDAAATACRTAWG